MRADAATAPTGSPLLRPHAFVIGWAGRDAVHARQPWSFGEAWVGGVRAASARAGSAGCWAAELLDQGRPSAHVRTA